MNIGRIIRIHNIPEPQQEPVENPFQHPLPDVAQPIIPIPVPDWPVKVPEKVDAE